MVARVVTVAFDGVEARRVDVEVQLIGADGPTTTGSDSPFAGWMSHTYGDWKPSPWREATADAGWTVWGAGSPRALTASTRDTVEINGGRITLVESENAIAVEIVIDGITHRVEAQAHGA